MLFEGKLWFLKMDENVKMEKRGKWMWQHLTKCSMKSNKLLLVISKEVLNSLRGMKLVLPSVYLSVYISLATLKKLFQQKKVKKNAINENTIKHNKSPLLTNIFFDYYFFWRLNIWNMNHVSSSSYFYSSFFVLIFPKISIIIITHSSYIHIKKIPRDFSSNTLFILYTTHYIYAIRHSHEHTSTHNTNNKYFLEKKKRKEKTCVDQYL